MKRSFRAGAVFTGVAACAVGLTGTANAAPDAPAMYTGNCQGASGGDVHLYYGSAHPLPACLSPGYIGENEFLWPSGKRFQSYCGGDYSGYIDFLDGRQGHFTRDSARHKLFSPVTGIYFSKYTAFAGNCASHQ
jgi:hypothetical protein